MPKGSQGGGIKNSGYSTTFSSGTQSNSDRRSNGRSAASTTTRQDNYSTQGSNRRGKSDGTANANGGRYLKSKYKGPAGDRAGSTVTDQTVGRARNPGGGRTVSAAPALAALMALSAVSISAGVEARKESPRKTEIGRDLLNPFDLTSNLSMVLGSPKNASALQVPDKKSLVSDEDVRAGERYHKSNYGVQSYIAQEVLKVANPANRLAPRVELNLYYHEGGDSHENHRSYTIGSAREYNPKFKSIAKSVIEGSKRPNALSEEEFTKISSAYKEHLSKLKSQKDISKARLEIERKKSTLTEQEEYLNDKEDERIRQKESEIQGQERGIASHLESISKEEESIKKYEVDMSGDISDEDSRALSNQRNNIAHRREDLRQQQRDLDKDKEVLSRQIDELTVNRKSSDEKKRELDEKEQSLDKQGGELKAGLDAEESFKESMEPIKAKYHKTFDRLRLFGVICDLESPENVFYLPGNPNPIFLDLDCSARPSILNVGPGVLNAIFRRPGAKAETGPEDEDLENALGDTLPNELEEVKESIADLTKYVKTEEFRQIKEFVVKSLELVYGKDSFVAMDYKKSIEAVELALLTQDFSQSPEPSEYPSVHIDKNQVRFTGLEGDFGSLGLVGKGLDCLDKDNSLDDDGKPALNLNLTSLLSEPDDHSESSVGHMLPMNRAQVEALSKRLNGPKESPDSSPKDPKHDQLKDRTAHQEL